MGSGSDAGSRRGLSKPREAYEDELDAGWDDEPAPVSPASGAAPSSPGDEPVSVTESPIPLVRRVSSPSPVVTESESLSPSEVETPGGLSAKPGVSPIVTALAAAAALVVVGGAWLRRAPSAEPHESARAMPVAVEPLPPAVPAQRSVPAAIERIAPVDLPPSPAASAATAPSVEAPVIDSVSSAATERPADSTRVLVKSIPEGAIFFQAGKRLGVGLIQVEVAKSSKLRLTALLAGYEPMNFKLDGSRESLTVRLTRARPAAEAPAHTESAETQLTPTPLRD